MLHLQAGAFGKAELIVLAEFLSRLRRDDVLDTASANGVELVDREGRHSHHDIGPERLPERLGLPAGVRGHGDEGVAGFVEREGCFVQVRAHA